MPSDIVNGFSDDQIALIGCFVSLIVTGTMMSLSYYIGAKSREESKSKTRFIPLSSSDSRRADDTSNPGHREAA